MPLYEVAILEQPTKNEREDGVPEKLIFGPVAVVARDEQGAAISAVLDRQDSGAIEVDRSRMTIIVRPFA